MHVKILSVRKIAAADVRKGDFLINPRLPNGFGSVELVGTQTPSVVLVVGKGALPYDPSTEVEVADRIVNDSGYGRRLVENDAVAFRCPQVLYEGDVD